MSAAEAELGMRHSLAFRTVKKAPANWLTSDSLQENHVRWYHYSISIINSSDLYIFQFLCPRCHLLNWVAAVGARWLVDVLTRMRTFELIRAHTHSHDIQSIDGDFRDDFGWLKKHVWAAVNFDNDAHWAVCLLEQPTSHQTTKNRWRNFNIIITKLVYNDKLFYVWISHKVLISLYTRPPMNPLYQARTKYRHFRILLHENMAQNLSN